MKYSSVFSKWIDSEDLETAKLDEEPVVYHEAWKKLCSCG
jgi:hypothetical protein